MKIKNKLRIVVFLPLLVLLMAIGTEYWVNAISEGRYAQGALVIKISQVTHNLVNLTYEYGITRSVRASSQWLNQYAVADQTLHEMPALFELPADAPQLTEFSRAFQKAKNLFDELQAYDKRRGHGGGDRLAERVRANLVNRINLEMQAVLPLADGMHAGLVSSIKQLDRYGSLLNMGIVLSLVLSLLALSHWVTSGINRALFSLQAGIRAVSDGNLAFRVGLETNDELGELARGFDAMTVRLAQLTVSRDELSREVDVRRLAEESLTLSESRLREAQRMAHIGSWMLDHQTNVLTWTEETYRIFELDQQGFAGTYGAFTAAIHPEDRQMVGQAYARSLANKTPYSITHRLLMKDGRVKFVHERCETRFSPEGTPLVSIGTAQDVTDSTRVELELQRLNEDLERLVADRTRDLQQSGIDLQEAQRALMNIVEDLNEQTAELEKANTKLQGLDRLKSLFIASMSHELRTPLNSIIGFSSIVLDEWFGPLNEEQKAKLATVLRTGKHLLTLVNDVIDVSKIEAGNIEVRVEAFDLVPLVDEALEMIRKECADKGIALRHETVPLQIHSDRQRLFQCLVNLLGNAVKFTEQGMILVRCDVKAGQVRITVSDTGIGIGEDDIPRLFTSFTRIPSHLSSSAKGTGLGLYLVKKITTEILHGEVGVESKPGIGSSFFMEIPISRG